MTKVNKIVKDIPNYFLHTVDQGQRFYIDDLNIPAGIAKNRAFKENIFVMLVGMQFVCNLCIFVSKWMDEMLGGWW